MPDGHSGQLRDNTGGACKNADKVWQGMSRKGLITDEDGRKMKTEQKGGALFWKKRIWHY